MVDEAHLDVTVTPAAVTVTTPDATVQVVAAHTQAESHRYVMHFPEHGSRPGDPHYADFNAYHTRTRKTARCYTGSRIGFDACADAQQHPLTLAADGEQSGLELHHSHIEWSLQNAVDLAALEVDYPGVSNPDAVGAWVETAENLRWYCAKHHRGQGGAHAAAHSDFEGEQYVKGLISG